MKQGWIRVRKSSRCPLCHSDHWCCITNDGRLILCMRVQSERPCKNGGWIHRTDAPLPIAEYLDKTRTMDIRRLTHEEIEKLSKAMYEHEFAQKTRRELALNLGVFDWALDRLRVGYGKDRGGAYASFPCLDQMGRTVGIIRRYHPDGAKRTYPGTSNTGLFYEPEWFKRSRTLLIVEGASDVAACISEGIAAIGRPSNTGGSKRIAALVKASGWHGRIVLVAECDRNREKRGGVPGCTTSCQGCQHCWPGLYGARKVYIELKELGVESRIKFPRIAKDARGMHNSRELQEWVPQ